MKARGEMNMMIMYIWYYAPTFLFSIYCTFSYPNSKPTE